MANKSRRQALKYLGSFGTGVVLGGGGTAYYAVQYFSETNDPNDTFGRAPPDLDPQVQGSDGPLVAVYADYACPHCHEWEIEVFPELAELIENGEIRFAFRDYPIPVDQTWSWRIPNVPRSAQAQTGDVQVFWDVHQYIWNNWPDREFNEGFVRSVAREFDLDEDRMWEETRGQWYRPHVEFDRELAGDDGVDQTPSVVVDGDLLSGNSESLILDAISGVSD